MPKLLFRASMLVTCILAFWEIFRNRTMRRQPRYFPNQHRNIGQTIAKALLNLCISPGDWGFQCNETLLIDRTLILIKISMNRYSLLLISLALLSIALCQKNDTKTDRMGAPPSNSSETTNISQPTQSLTHWVFALDKSKSMGQSNWDSLNTLMGKIANKITNGKMSVYTFVSEATEKVFNYQYGDPAKWNSSVLPSTPEGGRNFGGSLLPAIDTIMQHKTSQFCFAIITHGEVSYSAIQVAIFKKMMQERSKKNCTACYFIRENADKAIPQSFSDLCKSIQAQVEPGDFSKNFDSTVSSILKFIEKHPAA